MLSRSLLALTALLISSSAFARAEIQMFMNYKGPQDYDMKLVSTSEEPLSAEALYFEHWQQPVNGACYNGEPAEAIELFTKMVDLMNVDMDRDIRIIGESYYDEELQKPALSITARDGAHGEEWNWFPRMRECAKWETEVPTDDFPLARDRVHN